MSRSRMSIPGRFRPVACAGVVALLAALVVAACSGASTGGTAGTTASASAGGPGPSAGAGVGGGPDASFRTKPDPCKLVTNDEWKSQLGFPVKDGQLDPISAASGLATGYVAAHCTWYPQDAKVFNSMTIVIHDTVASDAAQSYQAAKTQQGAKPLSGVGDDAFILVKGAGDNSTVNFLKHGWYVELNMGGADWQVTETELTSIAKLVASRV